MENASKALIIAGAILISILLISIGVILINSGRDVTETGTSGMQSQQIQAFNAQFTIYEGTKKGSEIRGLWNAVYSSNGAYGTEHSVTITPASIPATLQANSDYTVTLDYTDGEGNTNGYVQSIEVTGPEI